MEMGQGIALMVGVFVLIGIPLFGTVIYCASRDAEQRQAARAKKQRLLAEHQQNQQDRIEIQRRKLELEREKLARRRSSTPPAGGAAGSFQGRVGYGPGGRRP